jgi:hypothetical protein
MAYAAGAGTRVSQENIADHVEYMTDHTDDVMAVFATQNQFGIALWGAIDGLCRKRDWTYPAGHVDMPKPAILVIKRAPDADDIPPIVARRVPKDVKRARSLATMVQAKRQR